MYKYEAILDLNRLYTNSIHTVAEHYGIEAAYQAIIKVSCSGFDRFVHRRLQTSSIRLYLLENGFIVDGVAGLIYCKIKEMSLSLFL